MLIALISDQLSNVYILGLFIRQLYRVYLVVWIDYGEIIHTYSKASA